MELQAALLPALDRLEAAGALRAEHRLHLRCELPAPELRELFEPFARSPRRTSASAACAASSTRPSWASAAQRRRWAP